MKVLRLFVLSVASTTALACSAPLPPAPQGGRTDAPVADQRFGFARTIARRGGPSPTPHLDALAELAARTTPELGLDDLLASQGSEPGVAQLRPGDRVEVTVVSHPEFSGVRTIGPDGRLGVASLGPFRATGLTPEQLGARIRAGLEAAVLAEGQRPSVSVTIAERAPRTVQVLGRVAANVGGGGGGGQTQEEEGFGGGGSVMATDVPLPADRALGIYGLVAVVQGLAADADEDRLMLIRKAEAPAAEDGGARRLTGSRTYHFSFRELVAASLQGREAWLEPDDQLLVPRLSDVYAYGAVARPGRHPLRRNTTVASLLLQVGGVNELAEVGRVLLLDGDEVQALGPDDLTEVLKPGQVLFVPAGERVYVVGPGAARNGPLLLPHTGLTVVQAIAEAGWFTPQADPNAVEILRPTKGGRQRIQVPVEAILDGERPAEAYMLRPGDTIIVPEALW